MASNALSARRGPIRRPKVCLTHVNPGRCEPPPPPGPATCSIVPSAVTVDVGDVPGFDLLACDPAFPVGEEIGVVVDDVLDNFTVNDLPVNCRDGSGEYEATEEGVFLLTMTVTFPDLSTCVATAIVTVEDPFM